MRIGLQCWLIDAAVDNTALDAARRDIWVFAATRFGLDELKVGARSRLDVADLLVVERGVAGLQPARQKVLRLSISSLPSL